MAPKILCDMEGVVHKICFLFSRIAGIILIFLVLTLVGDTIGRFIGYPILGSFELVQYGFALIVCFSIAYTDVEGDTSSSIYSSTGFQKQSRSSLQK